MVSRTPNIWIVVPAYNEAVVIGNVLQEIKRHGFDNVIVVSDGSQDDTSSVVEKAGFLSLAHPLRRGKGAATKTGLEAAKLLGADIVVTMDGDGQHDPADITAIIEPLIAKESDVVLGTRMRVQNTMPWFKIWHNKIANFITWSMYGLWVTDSQSGFRAYTAEALKFINPKADKYEYESEIIREIYLHKLKYCEVPIRVYYTSYSMSKTQKQGLLNGIRTFTNMIWNLIS